MITSAVPSDWRQLQDEVGRILRECGFSVEVERDLRTIRGITEIDVYAEEINRGRKSVILCECKRWKKRVPQTVVHAFRNVVADTGANVGYIIGSSGFQSGAFQAADLTNVRLLTWEEFQEEFEEQWLHESVLPSLWKKVDRFLTLAEPLPPRALFELDDEGQAAFLALRKGYQPLNALISRFTPWMQSMTPERIIPSLPLDASDPKFQRLPEDIRAAQGYRELVDLIVTHADVALTELRGALHTVAE